MLTGITISFAFTAGSQLTHNQINDEINNLRFVLVTSISKTDFSIKLGINILGKNVNHGRLAEKR